MPSQTAMPRSFIDGGSSNRLRPPVKPTCSPRSTISMPSVTMKALSRNLRIRKPLTKPIAAPISSVSGMASSCGRTRPKAPVTISTASAGARPTVDSSDRSNLPEIRIIASASTTSDSSVCCCSTLVRFCVVRNTGSTKKPISSSTSDHRNERQVAQPGERMPVGRG